MAIGRALATATLGLALAGPAAEAALLQFSFIDDAGETGSFRLDTGIADADPSAGSGGFAGAISAFAYRGGNVAAFSALDTGDSLWGIAFVNGSPGGALNFAFAGSALVDSLSANPADYAFISGSIFNDAFGDRLIVALSVDEVHEVPEPWTLALLGGGVVGLGFAAARRRARHPARPERALD
jgi:hypothetical protein